MIGKMKLALDIEPELMFDFAKAVKAHGLTKTYVVQNLMRDWVSTAGAQTTIMVTKASRPPKRKRMKC